MEEILVNLILIAFSCAVLIKVVSVFIISASKISRFFGISEYTISFLVVAVATSLPETVVGITSALQKNPVLSYGTAVGSNIALLTLVVAIPVLLSKSISTKIILRNNDAYFSILLSIVPFVLILDKTLSKTDGLLLLLIYCFYSILVLRRSKGLELILNKFENIHLLKQILVFLVSLGLLLVSSELIVYSAKNLSASFGWSLGFIGLTITAVGTSLPEIAFGIGAIKGRHKEDVLGNITGSLVANSTFVLGITALLHPIQLKNQSSGLISIAFVGFISLIFLKFVKSKEKLDFFEAMTLLILYLIFIAIEYKFQGV